MLRCLMSLTLFTVSVFAQPIASKADTIDSSNVTYLAPYSGAASQTQAHKNSLVVDVTDFGGADPSGASDSTGAFQSAVAAVSAKGGGFVNFCGTFRISNLVITQSNVKLQGCWYGGATILQTTATGPTIKFGGTTPCCNTQNSGIANATIQPASGVTRTADAAIQCAFTFKCQVQNNDLESQFIGIDMYGSELSDVRLNYVHQTLTGTPQALISTKAIWEHGTAAYNAVGDYFVDNFLSSANKPAYGMFIGCASQGWTLRGNQGQNAYQNLYVTTACGNSDPAQPVAQGFMAQNIWDMTAMAGASCTSSEYNNNSASFHTDGAANIYTITSVGDWFASSLCGSALDITGNWGGSGGTVSNLTFTSPQALNAAGDGIHVQSASNIMFTMPQVFGNSRNASGVHHGIDLEATATHISVRGGFSRPTANLANTQGYGIVLQAGGSDYIQIEGVDVFGNSTGGIYNLSTGAHNIITSNLGYNPVGGRHLTAGASPWTYKAGASPETLFLTNGTCSLIAVDGVGVYGAGGCVNQSFELGPNESVTVTYSVAPGANTIVH